VPSEQKVPLIVDRYAIYEAFASGGMASVHYGLWLRSDAIGRANDSKRPNVEFARPVAVKRLHPDYAKDEAFVEAFVDEAKLASRVRHPNVIATLDVVHHDAEVLLVSEFVEGESLMRLLSAAGEADHRPPIDVTCAIIVAMLRGLGAAHGATDEHGKPLGLVHRDVSPHNVIVGLDGSVRVIDFGIAKASNKGGNTREGQLKGKLGYMAPERLNGEATIASDLYAVGVCAWEMLTLRRMFQGDNPSVVLAKITNGVFDPPSRLAPDIPASLEAVVLRALDRSPSARFASATEMATAIESATTLASASSVGAWVDSLKGNAIRERAQRVAEIERQSATRPPSNSDEQSSKSLKIGPIVVMSALVVVAATWFAYRHFSSPPVQITAATVESSSAHSIDPPPTASVPTVIVDLPDAARTVSSATSVGPVVRPASPGKPACDPPYVVDATGVRRYKKECFKR
jgi:eukaryotic-like serine/threonine-protein kinase